MCSGTEAKCRLRSEYGYLEISLQQVQFPDLGNHELNPFALSFTLDLLEFKGDFTYGHYLQSLHILFEDLERVIQGDAHELEYPSPTHPRLHRDIHPRILLKVYEDKLSRTGWTLFFAFGDPQIWHSPYDPPKNEDSSHRFTGVIAVRFAIEYECLVTMRETMVSYLRSLGPRKNETDEDTPSLSDLRRDPHGL